MAKQKLTDAEAKAILLKWPESTEKLWDPPQGTGRWLRSQPVSGKVPGPRIASPGAKLFTTQPDGLFVYFNDIESCDLVVIEICGTIQNLNDKRSRYMPSSHSLVLKCSANWMSANASTQGGGQEERWKIAGTIATLPGVIPSIPIRHLRVLYALPNSIYKIWCRDHSPTGYEYFCRHSSLDSYNSQKMQTFLRRMSIAAQFYSKR